MPLPAVAATSTLCRISLCLPVVAYLLAAVWAHEHGDDRPTGDEPMYLLAAESLVDDFDVDLRNNAKKVDSQEAHLAQRHCASQPYGWFSIHNLGLSMLIALPWALGGPLAARLALAACCGLAAPALYRIIHAVWRQPRGSLLIALALALGMPLVYASRQIYPDLPAGLLLLLLAGMALTPQAESTTLGWRDLLPPIAFAFLPWLHVKYAAPALVVFAWHASVGRWKRSLLNGAALATALALLAEYNSYAFGKLSGPYPQGMGLHAELNSLIVFMGLHFDQAQGLFLQQPLWLLGLVGLAPMWRSSPRTCAWWLALYLAAILPNAMHPNWYGGYSFIGRFGATAVLLWAIPLAYGARALFPADGRAPVVVAAAAIAWQLCMARGWLAVGDGLMNQEGRLDLWRPCAWAYNGFYPSLFRPYLPYWQPFVEFWRYPANFSATIVAGGMVAFGLCLPHRPKLARRCLLATALGAVLVAAAMPIETPSAVCTVDCLSDFPGRVGRTVGTRHIAQQGVHGEGPMAFAPGFYPSPGDYRVILDYRAQSAESPVGHVMFHNGKTLAMLSTISANDESRRNVSTLHVPRSDAGKPAFLMVWYTGHGTFAIARLEIKRI